MQIRDDGTHAILPATRYPKGRRDRAKLPVTWLRQTDGKLRRNGYAAAIVQPRHAVAERGKLHGALGLLAVEELQIRPRCRRVFDDEDGEHRWRKRRRRSRLRGRTSGRLKRQDKSASPRRRIGGRKFLCPLLTAWHHSENGGVANRRKRREFKLSSGTRSRLAKSGVHWCRLLIGARNGRSHFT